MCKNCLSYQFSAQSNLSVSANPAPAPDVQAPAVVVETTQTPSSEATTQNGNVAGAAYVEVADAPANVSTPYEIVAGDTFTGTTSTASDYDWIRITIDPKSLIEIKSVITSTYGSRVDFMLFDEMGVFIKSKDKYDEHSATLFYENASDESTVVYLRNIVVDHNYFAKPPYDYTVTVSEVPADRFRFEEGIDAPQDTSTPYHLVAGETFTGFLEYDEDWIRVTADAGQTIEVTIEGVLENEHENIRAYLHAEAGHTIGTRKYSSNSKIVLSHENASTEALDVYVDVDGLVSSYGLDYTVTVQRDSPPPPLSPPDGVDHVEAADAPDDVSTPYELAPGESFFGEVSSWNDDDWVRIDLTAGETYWFSADGSDELSDTWLRLRSADGSVLAWDDDAGPGTFSYLNFAPTTSGTYYLSVIGDQYSFTGTYLLSTGTRDPLPAPLFTDTETEDAPDNSTTNYNLVVGDSFSGILEDENEHEVDWVRISLEADETYVFTLDTYRAYLTLSNDGGHYLNEGYRESIADKNILVYRPYKTGDYYLGASSPAHSSFSGNYEITSRRLIADETTDAAASTSTAVAMSVGETFTGLTNQGSDNDWISIQLDANNQYVFELENPGHFSSSFRLRNSNGAVVADNENGSISYTALSSGNYYLEVSGSTTSNSGFYELTANAVIPSVDQIADYLSNGYWGGQFAFDVAPGGTLTADITGLTADGKYLARNALDAWTAVTGINFRLVSNNGQITFDDNEAGANAEFFNTGSTITSADVNVSTGWLATYGTTLNSYSFQTYIHEIGHALGLGHAGNYNSDATYGVDNLFLNDSWQTSVMSYFDQEQNTYVDASFALLLSPMVADILAIQQLYGPANNIHAGNTTYGFNSTAGGYLDDFVRQNGAVAGTIADSSGVDTLDFSGFSAVQVINLNAEQASNIGGLKGNFFIARGTVIENAIGGGGADVLIGNSANNVLRGGGGADTFSGYGGDDTIYYEIGDNFWFQSGAARNVGGSGTDTLVVEAGSSFRTAALGAYGFERFIGNSHGDHVKGHLDTVDYYLNGGGGNDVLTGSAGDDTIVGGVGNDFMSGGAGNDTIHYTRGDNFWHAPGVARDVGGSGKDTLIVEAGSYFQTAALGAYGFERFYGNTGNDRITGQLDSVNYYLNGGGGNDVLTGSAGDDTLIGGAGNDLITGGDGNDWIHYSNGDFFWHVSGRARDVGGAGIDTLIVEAGSFFRTAALGAYGFERFYGNAGNDSIRGHLDDVDYYLDGGDGNDALTGSGGDDTIIGGAGNDTMSGGAGNDTIHYSRGDFFWHGSGQARDVGGDGVDTLVVEAGSFFRTSALGAYGFERFIGNAGNDAIKGHLDDVDYYLDGGAGNDVLTGSAGDDTIIGGVGNDLMFGGDGNDTIHYTRGDNFWFGSGMARDIGGAGIDTLVVEEGSYFLTSALGAYGFERFVGNAGNDRVTGQMDNVQYHLDGGAGNDILEGAASDDTLIGGAGADTLVFSGGVDELTGGAGADIFLFRDFGTTEPFGFVSHILDFEDGIDLFHVDRSGDAPDTFDDLVISARDADGVTGVTVTYWDNHFVIRNVNVASITADDFVFF